MRAAEYAKGETSIFYRLDLRWLMRSLINVEVRSMNDPTGLVSRINAVSSEDNRRKTLRLLQEAEKDLAEAYDLDGEPGQDWRY
jgi:hypothetical protein